MADQTKFTHKLKGAKVLVIGGTSGIGFGVAEGLVEHGSTVVISSSNQARIDQKVEELKKSYPSAVSRVSGFVCNLGDAETLEDNLVRLLEHCGKLDHIVSTAGDKLSILKLDEMTLSQIQQAGMVRFFTPLMIAKHGPKYLNAGPKSSIVFTTGSVSERPIPGWSVPNAYATGLQGLTRGLALDLKPIRVNLVSPGAVMTEMWSTMGMSAEEQKKTFDGVGSRLPTGRVTGPEEIAEAYLYLLRDSNVTGTMVSTNGGHLLVGPSH